MNKCVLCFLTIVIVSARCSVESIPTFRETSDVAVARSTLSDEHGKPNIRGNNATKVPEEERENVPFVIESFISSLKVPRKSSRASIITMDVSLIKEDNKLLAAEMKKLGVDIDGVVALANEPRFRSGFLFSPNNLEWMVFGKLFFDKVGSIHYKKNILGKTLFKKVNMRIDKPKVYKAWAKSVRGRISAKIMFGKMLWLLRKKNLNLHIADAAKMAFGSEYLNQREWGVSDRLIKAMTEYEVVDKEVYSYLPKLDEDPRMKDLTADELLKIATRYYISDDLNKESLQ